MPEILRLAHFLIHSTQLHHPTKPNMAAASLVINLLTGHHPNSGRTSGISLLHHGINPGFDPKVPSIGAGVHEGHGGVERCLPSI